MSTEFVVKDLCLKYFGDVGFASAVKPPSLDIYSRWLSQGHHGSMHYLERHLGQKQSPQELLSGAKNWIVLGTHYDTQEPLSVDVSERLKRDKKGWIARYARGGDYHKVISLKHETLISELQQKFPTEKFLGCVDSKAVLERDTAFRAGLGWIGKNTCLIDQKKGSFFFISEILTTLALDSDKPAFDHCGTCTKCLDACPTGALEGPRQLNATKCISYWTIESKEPAPATLSAKFGQNIFGCDICQDVCPWNQKARRTLDLPLALSSGEIDLAGFLSLSDDEIKRMTRDSAMSRAKPQRLRESVEVALKNCESLSHPGPPSELAPQTQ